MTQEQIIKEYNRLVSEIGRTRIYDGRGEYNGYTCDKWGEENIIKSDYSCLIRVIKTKEATK